MSAPAPLDVDESKFSDSSPPNSPGAIHLPPSSQPSSPINLGVVPKPWGAWSQADYRDNMFIRGPTYLQSQHKIACRAPFLECVDLEVLISKGRQENTAQRQGSPLTRLNASHPPPAGATALSPADPSFTFVINFMVPLKSEDGVYVVMYFKHRRQTLALMAAPPARPAGPFNEQKVQVTREGEYGDAKLEAATSAAFIHSLQRFLQGNNEYRDKRLKFIPHLIEGGWVVKKAVGTKPAVLGSKLKASYHTNAALNSFEVDIDVCSSKIAANIFSIVKKAAKELVIDLSFTLEGQEEATLPEALIAAARIIKIDVSKAQRV